MSGFVLERRHFMALFLPQFYPSPIPFRTASSATYYVDATGGNDSNDGKSSGAAWKTMTKVNAATLNPGDTVLLKAGERWRGVGINPTWNGSSSRRITFSRYGAGANPIIDGSVIPTSWTSIGSNRWTATATLVIDASLYAVWFDGSWGNAKTSQAAVTSARDWYHTGSTLTVFSTTNPASAYTAPGVEVGLYRPIDMTASAATYLTFDQIDLTHSGLEGVKIENNGVSGIRFTNFTTSKNFNHGILVAGNGSGDFYISSVISKDNGDRGTNSMFTAPQMQHFGHGFYIMPQGNTGWTITDSTADNNMFGFQIQYCVPGVLSYSIAKNNLQDGIALSAIKASSTVTAHHNLVTGNGHYGLSSLNQGYLPDEVTPDGGTRTLNIYHNTITGSTQYGVVFYNNISGAVTTALKNNIAYNNGAGYAEFATADSAQTVNLTSDYNIWYNAAAYSVLWQGATGYSNAQLATFRSSTSQEAHGLFSDPNLNATTYVPNVGSPALVAGLFVSGVSTTNPPNIGAKE